ncbi:MAG: RagB/SusD family nutrient uptake outer membrane protein [Bacteroidaceae bacterium]|nr:RagB/SusD family nutrient uptake outer membrane protein [Bacteroidaceae bacterium]
MKKIKTKISKTIGMSAIKYIGLASGIMMVSCDDFLTITPSDQIVEEDFWEDKNDLQNVVSACYTRYVTMMDQLIQWGEIRSDNLMLPTGVTNTQINNVMNANLNPTYSMFDWTNLYNEINFCNKILAHGTATVRHDESFSSGDWDPIKAEMITLRALSHFYLVRTWGEIPYITIDYNNDSQNFIVPQSSQEQVLDSIINDLESVKDIAMNDYGQTVWNKGRITKKAVYSLLADVYLWRASKNTSSDSVAVYGNQAMEDYQKCIDCCDWVINSMIEDRVKELNKDGVILGGVKKEDLTIEDLLIPNEDDPNNKYATKVGSFENIFGTGNSQESIFELQIDGTNNKNTINNSYWDINSSKVGSLTSSDALTNAVAPTPNEMNLSSIFTRTDYRRWETIHYTSASQLDFPIFKYQGTEVQQYNGSVGVNNILQDNSATNFRCSYSGERSNTSNNANFIFYRLADIMLMKAEAISQIAQNDSALREGFNLCRNLFRRNNPYAYASNNAKAKEDSLNFDVFKTPAGLESLVMAERQREFFGEGKRWFDLVRYAQRKGGTSEMLKFYLGRKYSENKNAIFAKLSTITSLFSPIYTNEIKNNPLLHQNSVWKENESTSKTDEL